MALDQRERALRVEPRLHDEALTAPLPPSAHRFEYRLAYVVAHECVVLYDNERGKGDHRHFAGDQEPYKFISPDQLIEDFSDDIERWNRENRRT